MLGPAGGAFWFLGLVALAFFVAAVTLPSAHWIRRRILTGLPGRLVYVESASALMVHDAGVRGRPDAVVAVRRVFRDVRPVELKTTTASKPLVHHVVQLALEALLVEGAYGRFPRVGYLVYVVVDGSRRRHRIRLGKCSRRATLAFLNGSPPPPPGLRQPARKADEAGAPGCCAWCCRSTQVPAGITIHGGATATLCPPCFYFVLAGHTPRLAT